MHNRLERLTPRQREVLVLVADGLQNKEIACQLHITTHTVKLHVTHILRKLEVETRLEAALYYHLMRAAEQRLREAHKHSHAAPTNIATPPPQTHHSAPTPPGAPTHEESPR